EPVGGLSQRQKTIADPVSRRRAQREILRVSRCSSAHIPIRPMARACKKRSFRQKRWERLWVGIEQSHLAATHATSPFSRSSGLTQPDKEAPAQWRAAKNFGA